MIHHAAYTHEESKIHNTTIAASTVKQNRATTRENDGSGNKERQRVAIVAPALAQNKPGARVDNGNRYRP